MKKRNRQSDRFEIGRMIVGIGVVAFISVFAHIFLDALVAPSLSGREATACEIVESKAEMRRVDDFVFTAKYRYKYREREWTATALGKPGDGTFEFSRLGSRLELLEKYAPGTKHECYVTPENPRDAVLPVERPTGDSGDMPGIAHKIALGAFCTIFYSVGIFLIISAFPAARRLWKGKTRKILTGALLTVFSLPFASIGVFGVVSQAREQLESRDYIPVPAKIVHTGMHSHHVGGKHPHTAYEARIGYEYAVDGKKYESDIYSTFQISSRYERQCEILQNYKTGDDVTAFVSPVEPRKSVLVKSEGLKEFMGIIFFGVFAFFGIVMLCGGLWTLVSALAAGMRRPAACERRELRRDRSQFMGLLLFTVLWNVLSWSFGLIAIADGVLKKFSPAWMVLIFPIIGIGMIVKTAREICKALKAPRLRLTLSCAALQPGAPAQIDWNLDGAENVESLEIELRGWETKASGRRTVSELVESRTCCSFPHPPVPPQWTFGIEIPRHEGDDVKWEIVATIQKRGGSTSVTKFSIA